MSNLVIRTRPLSGPLSSFFRAFEDVEDGFLTPFFPRWETQDSPALNIEEDGKAYKVSLALPGIRKEDVTLTVEDNILSIQHDAKEEQEKKDEAGYVHREFCQRSFRRALRLPHDTVAIKDIKAKYKDGILMVEIPKKEHTVTKNVVPIG